MILDGCLARVADDRTLLAVDGPDAEGFLQGLLTNDVGRAGPDALVYAALLTPQGKFLVDALIDRPAPERFRLDLRAEDASALQKRLTMYKLRAKADIAPAPGGVVQIWRADGAPVAAEIGLADPRAPALGRRAIAEDPEARIAELVAQGAARADRDAYDAARIAARAPEAGRDLRADDAFPLEYDFERLAGVDFRKGCYVGQEVTARMKHKATLKKRLSQVRLSGGAPAEDGAIATADGRPAGTLGTVVDGRGLALLRVDRIGPGLVSGTAAVEALDPAPDGA